MLKMQLFKMLLVIMISQGWKNKYDPMVHIKTSSKLHKTKKYKNIFETSYFYQMFIVVSRSNTTSLSPKLNLNYLSKLSILQINFGFS